MSPAPPSPLTPIHRRDPRIGLQDLLGFLVRHLSKAATEKAWGQVVITVQDGQIAHVSTTRSFKADLPTAG